MRLSRDSNASGASGNVATQGLLFGCAGPVMLKYRYFSRFCIIQTDDGQTRRLIELLRKRLESPMLFNPHPSGITNVLNDSKKFSVSTVLLIF